MSATKLLLKGQRCVLALCGLTLILSGCASTWVEESAQWQPEKPVKALLCYYDVQSDGGADLIDLGKQAAGGKSFDDVGMNSYTLMAQSLKRFNLSVYTDRSRTKKLDSIAKSFKDMETGNEFADELLGSLQTQWQHPATSDIPFHRYSSLNPKQLNDIAEKVQAGESNEIFLAGELRIEDQDQYLVFKRYRLIFALKGLDTEGNVVFQARAEGFTPSSFLRNSWSEKRIETAMAKMFEKMAQVEVKNEISTFNNL